MPANPLHYPPWWTSWELDGIDLPSTSGYLMNCEFDSEGRPIASKVSELSIGDPDPRNPDFIIDRIDSVIDSHGQIGMAYLHLIPADGSLPGRHSHDWATCYPLVIFDLDSFLDLVVINYGNNLPTEFKAEVAIS